jgi:hypothetical protein
MNVVKNNINVETRGRDLPAFQPPAETIWMVLVSRRRGTITMKPVRDGAVGVIVGLLWSVGNSVFGEHDGHSDCLSYSDLRCQWTMVPDIARVLVLVGTVLVVYGIAAGAVEYVWKQIRTSN